MFFRSPIVRFFNRILNRVTITVVLVALQLLWLCWVFYSITTGTGRVWVNGLLNALSLLIILYLVRKDENSAYKVGWIALIGILPLLGGALYLAFGNKRPSKRLSLKMHAVDSSRAYWTVWMPAGRARAVMWQSMAPIRHGRTPVRSILPVAKRCIRSCWPIWKRLKRASFWNFSS